MLSLNETLKRDPYAWLSKVLDVLIHFIIYSKIPIRGGDIKNNNIIKQKSEKGYTSVKSSQYEFKNVVRTHILLYFVFDKSHIYFSPHYCSQDLF